MSLKQNTSSLQEIFDKINSLPTSENLDAEISIQQALIAE